MVRQPSIVVIQYGTMHKLQPSLWSSRLGIVLHSALFKNRFVRVAVWEKAFSNTHKCYYYHNQARGMSVFHDDALPVGWAFGRYGRLNCRFRGVVSVGLPFSQGPRHAQEILL